MFRATYVVQRDLLRSIPGYHLYLVAQYYGDPKLAGIYKDSDEPRLTWILVPLHDMQIQNMPDVFCADRHMNAFSAHIYNKHSLPVSAVTGGTPFHVRRHAIQLSYPGRVVPGIVRHESSYTTSGNAVEPWGRPAGRYKDYMAEVMLGSSLNTHHVFLSKHDQKNYTDLFLRKNLSASALRRFLDRSTVLRNGIDLEFVHGAVGAPSWPRGRSVGSFYRLDANKGTKEVLELYQKMSIAGQVDKVVVTWAHAGELAEGLPQNNKTVPDTWEFYPESDRATWLRKASKVSVAIFNSKSESSPVCPIEAAAVGCVPILPKRPWVEDMIPGWDLTYARLEDAHALVLKVLEDPETYGRKALEYAQKYDIKVLGAQYMGYVQDLAEGYDRIALMSDDDFSKFCTDSAIVRAVDDLVRGKDQVTWEEVLDKVVLPRGKLGDPMVLSHYDLPSLITRRTGFVDDTESSLPLFRKPA